MTEREVLPAMTNANRYSVQACPVCKGNGNRVRVTCQTCKGKRLLRIDGWTGEVSTVEVRDA